MKTLGRIFGIAVLMFVFAACGGNDDTNFAAPMGRQSVATADTATGGGAYVWFGADEPISAPVPVASPVEAVEAIANAVAPAERVRMVIQNAVLEMGTEDFEDVVIELRGVAAEFDGFVESEMLTTQWRRMFTIVMRVPAAEFDTALARVEGLADIRHASQTAQDVTDRFYDLTGNLETRLVEEERLLALIDEAENIHDLLALEMRLSDTRLAIETYRSQLTTMADQVSFSTITVTLFDTYEEDEIIAIATFGERIGGAFGESVDGVVRGGQNFIIFLAGVFIPLGLLGVFGYGVFLVTRRVARAR